MDSVDSGGGSPLLPSASGARRSRSKSLAELLLTDAARGSAASTATSAAAALESGRDDSALAGLRRALQPALHPAPPPRIGDAARSHQQRRMSKRASVVASTLTQQSAGAPRSPFSTPLFLPASSSPPSPQQTGSLLAEFAHGLTPGVVPESELPPVEFPDDSDASPSSNTPRGAAVSPQPGFLSADEAFGGPAGALRRGARAGTGAAARRRSNSSAQGEAAGSSLLSAEHVDDECERVLSMPTPWTQHVVGRHRTYWCTSRRHLLIRGKGHSEIGCQTALGTRDYMAATKSVLALVCLEEQQARAGLYNAQRGAYAALCEGLVRGAHFWAAYVSPLTLLSVLEVRRREAVMEQELRERGYVFQHFGASALVRWAERDRDEARARQLTAQRHMDRALEADREAERVLARTSTAGRLKTWNV